MPKNKTIYLVTLGCARNQVDSEVMVGRLTRAGWIMVETPSNARVIVVNTCCFIEAATEESLDTILALAELKRKGHCQRLIVAGCLPERFREAAQEPLAEVDVFLGTGAYDRIVQAAEDANLKSSMVLPDPDSINISRQDGARLMPERPSVYLKIAEGCNRNCTYCVIPKLRGRQKSRSKNTIVNEARTMIAAGAKELVLIAQESTNYGIDLSPPSDLADLLQTLAGLSDQVWVRLLYGHPGSISAELVETIANNAALVPYFDLPIQHASNTILKKMGRRYHRESLLDLFKRIRLILPDAALRTTMLVGFPGETENDFEQLLTFIKQVRFDHLGAFVYSDADDLKSHGLANPVTTAVAEERLEQVMALQQTISTEKNRQYLDQTMQVLVEEAPEPNHWVGRTVYQAPEVDGVTYIRSNCEPHPVVGKFTTVKIIDTMEYDLIGESIDSSPKGKC